MFILLVLLSFFFAQFFFGEYGFKSIKETEPLIIEKQSIYKQIAKSNQMIKNKAAKDTDNDLKFDINAIEAKKMEEKMLSSHAFEANSPDSINNNSINPNAINNVEEFMSELLVLFKVEIDLKNQQKDILKHKMQNKLKGNYYHMIDTLLADLDNQPNFVLKDDVVIIYTFDKTVIKKILRKANKMKLLWKISNMSDSLRYI